MKRPSKHCGRPWSKWFPPPPFCSLWRKHFTWKIWCWNDAPAREVLWIDAGLVALKPLDDILDTLGYCVVPTYHLLECYASEVACRGCRVDPEIRRGKITLACGLIGFRKEGRVGEIVKEALAVALTEEHIASTDRIYRHDQAIVSLLLYRVFSRVVMADGQVYMGWKSPRQVPGQKVWVHRRSLLAKDQAYFASRVSQPGRPFMPCDPVADRPFRTLWKRIFGTPERAVRRLLRGQVGKEDIYDGIGIDESGIVEFGRCPPLRHPAAFLLLLYPGPIRCHWRSFRLLFSAMQRRNHFLRVCRTGSYQ